MESTIIYIANSKLKLFRLRIPKFPKCQFLHLIYLLVRKWNFFPWMTFHSECWARREELNSFYFLFFLFFNFFSRGGFKNWQLGGKSNFWGLNICHWTITSLAGLALLKCSPFCYFYIDPLKNVSSSYHFLNIELNEFISFVVINFPIRCNWIEKFNFKLNLVCAIKMVSWLTKLGNDNATTRILVPQLAFLKYQNYP